MIDNITDLLVAEEMHKHNIDPEYGKGALEDANLILSKIAPNQTFTREQFAVLTAVSLIFAAHINNPAFD